MKYWNRKNGANRAKSSASSQNSSSETGKSSTGGENDERGVARPLFRAWSFHHWQVYSVKGADAVI